MLHTNHTTIQNAKKWDEFIFALNGKKLKFYLSTPTAFDFNWDDMESDYKSLLYFLWIGKENEEPEKVDSVISTLAQREVGFEEGEFISCFRFKSHEKLLSVMELWYTLYEKNKGIIFAEDETEKAYKDNRLNEGIYGKLSYSKSWVSNIDWSNFLTQDLIKYSDCDEYTTIFNINVQEFIHEGKVYFCKERVRTIYYIKLTWQDKEEVLNQLPKFIWEKQYSNHTVYINDKAYVEKEFLKWRGFIHPITLQYKVGKLQDKVVTSGEGLEGYHANQGALAMMEWLDETDTIFAWVEFEKSELLPFGKTKYKELASNGWRCERDSTVSAEYISPIISLSNIEKSIHFIKTTAPEILDASIGGNCGWHIHVSAKWVHCSELYTRMVAFMPLLWAIYPQRASNSYSNRPTQWDFTSTSWRRDFVLKEHIGTCEFRIFPWCQGERMLRFRLQLLKAIVEKWLSTEKPMTFSQTLEFIMESEEMFELIGYVYNTNEKLKWIVERINNCYKSVAGASIHSDITQNLYENLHSFVMKKKSNSLSPAELPSEEEVMATESEY